MENELKGMVFDIQRFSLHDGPGIRTTVFLKGCPLDCKWCHNPESKSYKPQIFFNQEKCNDCLLCVDACKYGAHQIIGGKHHLNFELCKTSGNCLIECPAGALKIIGKLQTVNEVMAVIIKDKDYYKNSGGGLTISGGEPMTQFNFTKELLESAKKEGIHTCIETCGYAPTSRYLQLTNIVDLFLFDYKETDPMKHKIYTGVSNELINKNLEILHEAGANIILRCPIIPGVNDTNFHFDGINKLQSKFPSINKIEIMPYHNLGNDKAKQIGMSYNLAEVPTADEKMKNDWLNKMKDLGCEKVVLG